MNDPTNLTNEQLVVEHILDAIPAGINIIDTNFTILKVNKWMQENFAEKQPLIGKKCHQVSHDLSAPHSSCPTMRALKSGKVESSILQIELQSESAWVSVTSFPLKDEKQDLYGFIEYLVDISDKKKDDQLQQVVLDISNAVHSATDTVDLIRKIREILGQVIDTSNFFVALYDKESDTLDLPFFIDEKDEFSSFPAGKTLTARVIRTGSPLLVKEEEIAEMIRVGLVDQFGSTSKVWMGVPLTVQGEIVGALVVQSYTSRNAYGERELNILKFVSEQIGIAIERKQTEKKLRQSEIQYRTTLNSIQDAIHVVDAKLYVILANNSLIEWNKILGLTEKVCGKYINEIYPFLSEHVINEYKHVLDTGEMLKTHETNIIDGKVYYTETRKMPMFQNDHATQVLTIIRDITSSRQHEVELARLAAAVEQTGESVVILSKEGKIEYVNPAYERITGQLKNELIGQSAAALKSDLYDAAFYESIWQTISSGLTWTGHVVYITRDGSRHEEDVSISPIFNENGIIENYVSVGRDVTREIAMQKQLAQAQKMEAIGTLAGGIAHDFNNILASIIGFSQLSLMQIPAGSKIERNIQNILKACDRARELTQQILLYSRGDDQEKQPLQIDLVVKEAIKLLKASLPSTITITQDIQKGAGFILGNATQIHQILMNLATNAAHAMPERKGRITITLQQKDMPEKNAELLEPGSYIQLVVSDTGHGMTEEIRERIFDPFFTTKPSDMGTGLGLSVVLGIVNGLHGHINVTSRPGKGSTFTIYIPQINVPKNRDASVRQTTLANGTETILFIDDEADLVQIGEEMLKSLGYNVVATTSSREGLELFKKKPHRFNLIITDQTMPEMTGLTLAKNIREIDSKIPIVLCTGFSETLTASDCSCLSINNMIAKPFYLDELSCLIRDVLEKKTH
ncbi:PAS domain S-box protein [candidate division KSB1 bacterium]|nr:PAS domain S-box protein [candidate division KSB1 bacterium]RQW00620.1 MAG: PAS domain S-box protein [candidate division KSB1 bacterium]